MQSVIDLLYEATEPTFLSGKSAERNEQSVRYYQAIKKAFNVAFADEFCSVNDALAAAEARAAFARGFRLGAQLFSEAMEARYSS